MKWQEIDSNEEQHRLTVEAEWSELSADYDDLLSDYRKLSIPGFRPGRAPQALIAKRFQKEILEDLSKRSAQRLGREVISEAGIEVWGPAEIAEISCSKEAGFRAELCFIPLPTVELPNLGTLIVNEESDPSDQLSLALLEQVDLEVPERLVVDELALDGIESDSGTPEWAAAFNRVKLMTILKQIALQEGIEVDEKDVENRMKEKAVEFGTTPKTLLKELAGGQGGGLQRLKEMLLAESVLDYLSDI